MASFVGLVCHRYREDSEDRLNYNEMVMTPKDIGDFMESIGRPAPPIGGFYILISTYLSLHRISAFRGSFITFKLNAGV